MRGSIRAVATSPATAGVALRTACVLGSDQPFGAAAPFHSEVRVEAPDRL